MGKEGESIREISDDKVEEISNRYIELYEHITGKTFSPILLYEQTVYNAISKTLINFK